MSTLIKLPDRDRGVVWKLPILFHDSHLLVLNKPAGLEITAQANPQDVSALLPLLHTAIADGRSWTKALELVDVMAAHRPEAQTSGVMILARNRPALESLGDQFGSGTVRQQYLALVRGGPGEKAFELDARLVLHPDRPGQMRSDSRRGKRYRTQCDVMERFRAYTLLQCVPSPGKSGQIAAHLRHARYPLVADPDRGGAGIFLSQLKSSYEPKKGQEERPLLGRPALHLETIELQHPVGGEPLSFTAPLAKDFTVALKYLRQFAA